MEKVFAKVCETLTDKIESLEFLVKYKEKQIEDLKAENAQLSDENYKLKVQKRAVSEFVDRTKESIETKG